MKKSELKTGMVVELRSGNRALVVKDNCYKQDAIIFANDNWTRLDSYSEDLLWHVGRNERSDYVKSYDIVKVYKPTTPNNFLNFKTLKDGMNGTMECIWEREKDSTTVEVQRFPNKTITITTTVRYEY